MTQYLAITDRIRNRIAFRLFSKCMDIPYFNEFFQAYADYTNKPVKRIGVTNSEIKNIYEGTSQKYKISDDVVFISPNNEENIIFICFQNKNGKPTMKKIGINQKEDQVCVKE